MSRALAFIIVGLLFLAGCTTGEPSCYDNPRNMRCMTGAELTAALEAK